MHAKHWFTQGSLFPPQMPDRLAGRPGSTRARSVLCAPLAQIKDFTSSTYCLATCKVPDSKENGSSTYSMLSLAARHTHHLVRIRAYCWPTRRRHASREKAMVASDGVCYSEPHLRDLQRLVNQDILLGHRWWGGWQRSGQQQRRPYRACWCGMAPRTASCTPLTYPSSPGCTLAECCSASCWPSTNPSLRCPLATCFSFLHCTVAVMYCSASFCPPQTLL